METKKITLTEIKNLQNQKLTEINSNFYNSDEVLLCVVNLLNNNNSFLFFIKNFFDINDIRLPYYIFGIIPSYIKSCYEKKQKQSIIQIFNFLDEMSQSKDKNILDLLLVGALEVFDYQKEILPDIIKFMPPNLKKIFLKHFSYYLE